MSEGEAGWPWWKKALVGLGVVVALLVGLGFGSALIWPPINDVTTGQTEGYPELQPQVFSASPEATFASSAEAIEGIGRMRVVERDAENLTLQVESDTPSGTFTDDVTLKVEHAGDGGSRVVIRSRSRVGELDFGQNAKNIREIQAAIADELGQAP